MFIGGPYFVDTQLRSGNSFVFVDAGIPGAEMLSLSAHVIRLMDDLYLPDLFRVHTTLGFARDAQVHTLIRYADTVLNRRPLDWVLDMVSMHFVAMLPAHRTVLGADARRWPESRFNMIARRIAAARTTAGHALPLLDAECVLANESFLLVRVPQAEAWAAEDRYDAQGAPIGKSTRPTSCFARSWRSQRRRRNIR